MQMCQPERALVLYTASASEQEYVLTARAGFFIIVLSFKYRDIHHKDTQYNAFLILRQSNWTFSGLCQNGIEQKLIPTTHK